MGHCPEKENSRDCLMNNMPGMLMLCRVVVSFCFGRIFTNGEMAGSKPKEVEK